MEAGFGQSIWADFRFWYRFRGCRLQPVTWHEPTTAEAALYDHHAIIGRFGDFTHALATVDGRRWVSRERFWNGWPDPPKWAFFALDMDGEIWCAVDFHTWPQRWRLVEARGSQAPTVSSS